jgi:hypothetical protein
MARLTPDDKRQIFLDGLKKHGLEPQGGASSLTSLSQAFAMMKSRLSGVADEDKNAFVAAIERAIDAEPNLPLAQRDAARDVLCSAFDGMARQPAVRSVKCNFLNRVRFD